MYHGRALFAVLLGYRYLLHFINLVFSLLFRYFTVYYNLWSDHVLGWWKHRNDPNVLFLKYEDLKKVCDMTAEHRLNTTV